MGGGAIGTAVLSGLLGGEFAELSLLPCATLHPSHSRSKLKLSSAVAEDTVIT